ncbi:MAG: hypothetical protein ACD_39C01285G0001, partial [uncultured bacterium]
MVDNGRLGEANLGDVIQIKVRLTNHDGILPMIDFTNLYLENGMTPPSPTLFPPNTYGGNEFTYQWTIPEGLGTLSVLTILAYDESGNMAYSYTNQIRFLSKTPVFAGFPQTRADLSSDTVPLNSPNSIANPGDQVTLTVVMTSLYNTNNIPNAIVLADIRSLINSSQDDSSSAYFDGDMRTYWVPLTYQTAPTSGPGNYVYRDVFNVTAGGVDLAEASFKTKVLHPDTSSIVMAESTITCDPENPFGIDTQIPYVKSVTFTVLDENNDNISSYSLNIDDLIHIRAEIEKFPDPGSATFQLMMPTGDDREVFQTPLYQISGTNFWEVQFRVATTTVSGWLALDNDNVRYRVMVSDDADNFATSTIKAISPYRIDNEPPEIISAELRVNEENDFVSVANVGDGYISTLGDKRPSDGLIASLTVTNASDLTDSVGRPSAYIDCSSILGTTTYPLHQIIGNIAHNTAIPYELGSSAVDLATYTIRIYVKDRAGNKSYIDKEVTVDSTRPVLEAARYDGSLLTLDFSEEILPLDFQNRLQFVRLGSKMDHTDVQVPGAAIYLDPINDLVMETMETPTINIQLSSYTKGIIADWGEGKLYISIAHNTTTGEAPAAFSAGWDTPLALDISGNWLRPLPRTLATFPVNITATYTVRPNLVKATYNANTPSEKDYLYLEFDKDMDATTIDDLTLYNLAIWRNRSNPDDSYANRYRFITTAASDTVVGLDTPRRVRIKLSQEAQDWIALNYTKNGSQFHMQINGSEYEPPDPADPAPLIRDFEGNRVNPITYQNATPSTLIPLNTQFSIRATALDLSGTQPILQISFQDNPERRARLYQDPYKNLAATIELSRDLPMDMSLIYLHEKADLSGRSIPLSTTMVDYTQYKAVNTDYASNTVYIPLTAEALKTMLSWGTSRFYIACTAGSFKDLWGNSSIRYPAQGNEASPINPITFPALIAIPRIQTVAISPAKSLSAQQIQLFKGQNIGNLFYEVSFETATLSANVYIPIDRTKEPKLELFTQDDLALPQDTAKFVSWLDHDQGGVIRTVARFTNNSDLTNSAVQRKPSMVRVSNFADIFSTMTYTETASLAYNLNDKDTSVNGFQNASYTMVLDSKIPDPLYVTPTGTVGITPAGGMTFNVAFSEPMDQTVGSSWQPQLRLGDNSNSVMSFVFSRWISSTTAQFTNSASFDANTQQGTYTYYVSGGFDEAGNRGNNDVQLPSQLQIRSKGPTILSYRVTTYQSTTAKYTSPTGDLTDAPFSPYVAPGIATITVNFQVAPVANSLWLHFYQGEATLASIPINITGLEGKASWDGTLNGVPIGTTGPTTYVMRVYDDAGNEGSNRGNITYDGRAPEVSSWRFSNVKTFNNKAYFSPAVNSFAKVDVFGPSTG